MKKIGILGGIGWPSTIEYYRLIHTLWQSRHQGIQGFNLPEISIESLNMTRSLSLRGDSTSDSWAEWENYFVQGIQNLENANCEVIAIASVTPHARLESIQAKVSTPILSIYESVIRTCKNNNISNCLVLGTQPTMKSAAFKIALINSGIEARYPENQNATTNTLSVINQLYENKVAGASASICEIVNIELEAKALGSTAICLGCTELSTAFPKNIHKSLFQENGITFLNAFVAHVEDIVERSLN